MRGIPAVREWLITLADGRRFRVLAPTRRLAILNLRSCPGLWGALKTGPAVARRQVGQQELVRLEDPL